jgi:hypothetical protein
VVSIHRVCGIEPVSVFLYQLVPDDDYPKDDGLRIGEACWWKARMNWTDLSPLLLIVAYFAVMRWVLPRFGVST